MTRRPPFALVIVLITASVMAGTIGLASLLSGRTGPLGPVGTTPTSAPPAAVPTITPVPTPRPIPGHEVFGYVPYWEMDRGIAAHLADTELTTLALFSVTNRRNGTLNQTLNGYKKIVGPIGQQVIREARDRGVRVELVFSSFGHERNERLFGGSIEGQDTVIASLVAFAGEIGVDGINVDVELLGSDLVASYGGFLARLREALRVDHPKAHVSVATTANVGGAAMAAAASTAGVDRIFLMGYDYHWSGSAPGASAPLDRADGDPKDLVWSLDLYEAAGVPVERTVLGLPLYGMSWPVDSAEPDAAQLGRGSTWDPSQNLDVLDDPTIVPTLDPIEMVQVYRLQVTEDDGRPGWRAIYVDSAETLTAKLALADDRGLAGAGFWAIGYERGQPDITKLIKRFGAGRLGE
jgi:spore germination protein YaaH